MKKVLKKWQIKVVMNKLMAFFLFLGIFSYSVGYVYAGNMDWHKPTPCFGCHAEVGGVGKIAVARSAGCGGCHMYKLDVQKLQENHDPKICKACHIGNTIANGTEREIFHSGHSAVNCTRCHTNENMTFIKIQNKNFECTSCHGNQIHAIHIKNLGKACPICHGSWAKDKVYKKEGSSLETTKKTDAELEKFTIFSFLKKLFSVLGM